MEQICILLGGLLQNSRQSILQRVHALLLSQTRVVLFPPFLHGFFLCSAVANLAVALLSLEDSEGRLLDFMARARTPLRKPLFDPKYALRLAKDRNRCECCSGRVCFVAGSHLR
jgi:hypothetical protein